MDAGIMDGTSLLFGAVGAVPGIKNPIMVAQLMVEEQRKGLLPLGTDDRLVGLGISLHLVMFFHLDYLIGRVPPGFLVGEGAREWAIRHGIPGVKQGCIFNRLSISLMQRIDLWKPIGSG